MDQPRRVAQLQESGLTRRQRDADLWDRPYRGVRRPASLDPTDPDVRIADVVCAMEPGGVLTGWAGARVHGVSTLEGRQGGGLLPVTVVSGRGQQRGRPGLEVSRRSLHDHEVEDVDGVRVASLARCAYDMALDARSLGEAVEALDTCCSTVTPGSRTTPSRIKSVLDSHVKTRGIALVRRALPLVSTRSASPLETSTRLVVVREAGYLDVRVNEPVFDLDGKLLGVADLLDVKRGIVVETDGDDHAGRSRRTRDNLRQEAMTRAGLVTVRVTADDHRDRRRLAARLRRIRREVNPVRTGAWTLDRPPWWWTWAPGRRWD